MLIFSACAAVSVEPLAFPLDMYILFMYMALEVSDEVILDSNSPRGRGMARVVLLLPA